MAPGVSSCHYRDVAPSISFSGSGFMSTYQLGVAQCFVTHAPWILHTAPCVLGASAGSLVAAAVVCDMSMSKWLHLSSVSTTVEGNPSLWFNVFYFTVHIRDEMLHFAKQLKAFTLGPFNPSINVFHWLAFILNKYLPSNAHKLANGRLSVSMTRLSDCKHIVMSEFHSKEDVLPASWHCRFTP